MKQVNTLPISISQDADLHRDSSSSVAKDRSEDKAFSSLVDKHVSDSSAKTPATDHGKPSALATHKASRNSDNKDTSPEKSGKETQHVSDDAAKAGQKSNPPDAAYTDDESFESEKGHSEQEKKAALEESAQLFSLFYKADQALQEESGTDEIPQLNDKAGDLALVSAKEEKPSNTDKNANTADEHKLKALAQALAQSQPSEDKVGIQTAQENNVKSTPWQSNQQANPSGVKVLKTELSEITEAILSQHKGKGALTSDGVSTASKELGLAQLPVEGDVEAKLTAENESLASKLRQSASITDKSVIDEIAQRNAIGNQPADSTLNSALKKGTEQDSLVGSVLKTSKADEAILLNKQALNAVGEKGLPPEKMAQQVLKDPRMASMLQPASKANNLTSETGLTSDQLKAALKGGDNDGNALSKSDNTQQQDNTVKGTLSQAINEQKTMSPAMQTSQANLGKESHIKLMAASTAEQAVVSQETAHQEESPMIKESMSFEEAAVSLEVKNQKADKKIDNPLTGTTNVNRIVADNPLTSTQGASAYAAQQESEILNHRVATDTAQIQKNNVQLQQETISIFRKDFSNAVKDKVMLVISQKLQQFEITLDPPEFGNMQVRVNLQGEQAAVNFVVQNQQAKDALEQNMHKLRDMLSEQGVDVGGANVEQQGSQNKDGENTSPGQSESLATQDAPDAAEHIIASHLINSSATGVDYYA